MPPVVASVAARRRRRCRQYRKMAAQFGCELSHEESRRLDHFVFHRSGIIKHLAVMLGIFIAVGGWIWVFHGVLAVGGGTMHIIIVLSLYIFLPIFVFAFIGGLIMRRLGRHAVYEGMRSGLGINLCTVCGYNLKGLEATGEHATAETKCPECGAVIADMIPSGTSMLDSAILQNTAQAPGTGGV